MTPSAWRGSQKCRQRVGPHVTPDELQILQLCRLVGYKAIRATRVTIRGYEPEKSTAAHGEVG